MNERITIIESIATIMSLIVSVVALVESHRQVKISNKQNLFNRRLESYLVVAGLIELYESNRQLIEKEKDDEIYYSSDFVFTCLINNSYLERMGTVIGKPLHQPEQKDFLKKVEELRNEALKIKYIFYEEESELLSRFVDSYAEVLMELYQYTVLIDSMRKMQEQIPKKNNIDEIAKDVNEIEYRRKLFSQFKELSRVYNDIKSKDILKRTGKQIKLWAKCEYWLK